jgi:hypothetical protein
MAPGSVRRVFLKLMPGVPRRVFARHFFDAPLRDEAPAAPPWFMIPPVMILFRQHNSIGLLRSHLASRVFAAASAIACAAGIAAPARADILMKSGPNTWIWNGGIATNLGDVWFGAGWDRFPGVNPPWNPVGGGAGCGGCGSDSYSSLEPQYGLGELDSFSRDAARSARRARASDHRMPAADPYGGVAGFMRPAPMPEPRVVVIPIYMPPSGVYGPRAGGAYGDADLGVYGIRRAGRGIPDLSFSSAATGGYGLDWEW